MPLDSVIDIVTPENIAFQYRAAGPFQRLLAFLIDVAVRWLIFFVLLIALAFGGGRVIGGGLTTALILLTWFVLDWFYGGFLETWLNGQTIGKRMLGLRSITVDGQPINALQAVLRNVLRLVDSAPLLPLHIPLIESLFQSGGGHAPPIYVIPTYLAGLISMSITSKRQRLGDLVCGTMVIVEERHWLTGVVKLEDPRAPRLAELIPGEFVVSRTMAQALSMYVERRRFLNVERRREIANHLAKPLLERFGMRADTSSDLLLCALYYRTFVTDRAGEQPASDTEVRSPFRTASPPDSNSISLGAQR